MEKTRHDGVGDEERPLKRKMRWCPFLSESHSSNSLIHLPFLLERHTRHAFVSCASGQIIILMSWSLSSCLRCSRDGHMLCRLSFSGYSFVIDSHQCFLVLKEDKYNFFLFHFPVKGLVFFLCFLCLLLLISVLRESTFSR